MKFQDWAAMPERSVYIISEDNEEGMLSIRGFRTVRECLKKEENIDLKTEYAERKLAIVTEGVADSVDYGQRKDEVVRKILKRAGWTDKEVTRKEGLDTRTKSEPRDFPY